ncbi:MAG: GNAT family N-acetyltransferase [Christensenellales bacterium]|jgi:RimJ/RimL family protein N-acetyltransferase
MVYKGTLEGRFVNLKACTEEDAEFTLNLRNDQEFVGYLPVINNTVDQQKAWIRSQRQKDGDYFFVVWNKEGIPIGTISIYGIHGDRAKSGRLAIKGSNPFQALEAQILCFRFAFEVLKLRCVDGFIFADNDRAIRFNVQFGGRHSPPELDENGKKIIKFEIWHEDFEKVDKELSSFLYRKKKH